MSSQGIHLCFCVIERCTYRRHMQQLLAFCHDALMMLQVRCRLLADASACCQAWLLLHKCSQSLCCASDREHNLNCTCTTGKVCAVKKCIFILQVHTTPVASRDWGNFRQRLLMDFGRIINKHGVHFAYPTQVNNLMTQSALLHMSAAACCSACMVTVADVLCMQRLQRTLSGHCFHCSISS